LEEIVKENTLAKFGCIATALFTDICFAFEIILIKVLDKYNVKGDIVGIFYVFFVGVIGIVGLSVYSISGGMRNEAFTNFDLIIIAFGGCFESLGMITTIYASAIGNAGIAFGISYSCCIYVTVFNFFAMNQAITLP
jgi:hypothetical protein